MKILIATAVESIYGRSFLFTWFTWLMYSLTKTSMKNYSISIAVGCMSNYRKQPTALRILPLLGGIFNCSNLFDIPGFEKDKRAHLKGKQYHISYPDVRRMMFLRALANSTIRYDMIVHVDVDAFIIRNPFPELIEWNQQRFSAAFSRREYNSSGMCFGFFALNNLSLPYYWTTRGIYSQNQINKWMIGNAKLLPEKQEAENSSRPISYWNVPMSNVSSDLRKESFLFSMKLLHEHEYYRGGCGETAHPETKVYHCLSPWFYAIKKEIELKKVSKLFNISSLNQHLQDFKSVIQPEFTEKIAVEGYYSRDHGAVIPGPYEIIVNTHRLVLSPNLTNIITSFSDWRKVCYAYSICGD